MALIIQKFGGTSVASPARIKEVVKIIKGELDRGNEVIVIVSAMAGVTNYLVTLCNEISKLNSSTELMEYDSALSSGEIVSAALLALSLQAENIKARSILAWQLPILTDENFGKALVKEYNTVLLKECLANKIIPIIAGFQGITEDNRLTTLGRGGSDITATLTAAIMQAERCDIYTDVKGVFTADPRIVSNARKLKEVSYEEMLEFASSGAKVLHPRCVEIARRYNVNLKVLSSFEEDRGTLITSNIRVMEDQIVTGITSNKNFLKISLIEPKINFINLCSLIAERNVHIEFILNIEEEKNFCLIVPIIDMNRVEDLLKDQLSKGIIKNYKIDNKIALVTILGYGIKNNNNIVKKALEKLKINNVPLIMLQTSEIKISLLIDEEYTEKVVLLLHELFQLDK